MKLMLVLDWSRSTFSEIGGKFATGVDAMPPDGVELIARWHDPMGRMAWIVVETAEAAPVQEWATRWTDYCDWTVHTVLTDAEIGTVIAEVLDLK